MFASKKRLCTEKKKSSNYCTSQETSLRIILCLLDATRPDAVTYYQIHIKSIESYLSYLSGTDALREDHKQITRLDKIIIKCYTDLYAGKDIPLVDIDRISLIIEEFLDSIHYSREEDSYFPCVASYDHLTKEIKGLLIEHEFSRNIAKQIKKHVKRWKEGEDAREPVARYLRTYSIFLMDHMRKEEAFFDKAQTEVLSKEEEYDMYEQFKAVMATSKKVEYMLKEIKYLEDLPWVQN